MMASLMSYFGGRKDTKQAAREAIVGLRQQLQLIEKKEEYLQKKIEEETRKAKANAVTNKNLAKQALIRKRAHEQELDKLAGSRLQLESQVNTLESANLNAETMTAMKKGADVLKTIHGNMTMDKVDATMAAIEEQRAIANEISEAISNPMNAGLDYDEEELKQELAELEQDQLNERLMEADHVPVHAPSGATRVEEAHRTAVEDDEDAQLRELQASLAM
ncbi:Snf7-domain-containing protein [Gloeophyllum trabeum ATCC 11539]|uniref:Vacuolar-sorting protein SNF7 n=1 Tax=Gloeophyllum trabeum (strain ATCC 11539 / FP-39264 / Madison 617) TaxID=670483 RepID=S7QIE7_GLOTA|nr:Snf7-domain-containing protein [Gloeophyllum trabeum ATCC 11539]EPQ58987.1 Snf7-domain-containing protein [Gloeophyllum trabeum ATCC 11539]